MIIVKLKGGLGNQLFQYAAGRCLANKHNTTLKLDLSFINADPKGAYTKRELELNAFNVKYEVASAEDCASYLKHAGNKYIRTINRKLPNLYKYSYFSERGTLFHEAFKNLRDNTYLDGFWQSEKYFAEIRTILLQEFSLKDQLPEEARSLISNINGPDSVSIHIRRGDYVSNTDVNSFHGTMNLDYYKQALELIKKRKAINKVFVFSDDIAWCKQNIKLELDTHFVEFEKPVAGCIEMMIMSKCKHNVIANSSFSWWAAWLNANPEKVVVAPKNWFQTMTNPDIYPSSWLTI